MNPLELTAERKMRNRGTIAAALVLIGIGAWFLSLQFVPALKDFAYGEATWPLQIAGIGAFLALVGLLTWTPGMFIPACIVGGIGGLLYYQNLTGDWVSWAYAWILIVSFNGLGILLTGLATRNRNAVSTGFWMAFISLLVFSIFAGIFGSTQLTSALWPVMLIALGVILLLRGLFRKR